MSTDYIFVYGSLRQAYDSPARQVLVDYAEYAGEGTYQGKLYKIEWYPGVVPSQDPGDIVHGEVYKITDKREIFSKLDQYEGCSDNDPKPHAFRREKQLVRLLNGAEVEAWIYLYSLSLKEKKKIPSGDYLDHLKKDS